MAMIRYVGCLAVLVAIETLTMPAARAADLVQPPWRGFWGATFQRWSFPNASNPASPDPVDNPVGDPVAAITVGMFGSGWWHQLGGFGTQTGYWDLGGSGGKIIVDIPNHALPLGRKEVHVQVTYFQDITHPPVVNVVGATRVSGQTLLVEHVSTGGDWMLDQSVWKIEPSPAQEQISLTVDPAWGAVVDDVVVDTLAVAEPDTCHTPAQDINGDTHVDADDLAAFVACQSGPTIPWPAGNPDCVCFDHDGDKDIDQVDFGFFQRCYSGPDASPAADCAR